LADHLPPLFHWEGGLKLTKADLAVDFRRRQPRAFISHAHSDHLARHEYALATPETIALYHFRLGPRPVLPMAYRRPIEWGGLRLTAFPAGHCLGSAMLLAEDGGRSLLYTGDFKLDQSATAERAELPRADVLVIESTYGTPAYRLPPRETAIEQLLALVRRTLAEGAVPVVQAYVLGKSQEVTKILTDAGVPVLQHRKIYEVSRVYRQCGMDLGHY
jgi:putative mRNA 3-end processing factor